MDKFNFDKIYCLHVSDNKEREIHIKKEFEKVGISDKVNIWWTCKGKHNTNAAKYYENNYRLFEAYKNKPLENLGYVYNCSIEYYNIIKTSYDRGFNNILIMEDDIEFIDDNSFDLLLKTMEQAPLDYDCIKYIYFYSNLDEYNKEFNKKIR